MPDLEKHIAKFFNLKVDDDQEEAFRRATVLSVRVRYWYQMRIPFANWIIFTSWYASNGGVTIKGAIDRGTVTNPKANMMNQKGNLTPLGLAAKGIKVQKGYNTTYSLEMAALWLLATGKVPLVSSIAGRRFFIPITATYSMRMQSNFNYKWIMHLKPGLGLVRNRDVHPNDP